MKKHETWKDWPFFNCRNGMAKKMTNLWLLAFMLLMPALATGQGWMKIYGENERLGSHFATDHPKLIRTGDSQYLIMCETQVGMPDTTVLLKIDTLGNLLWRKNVETTNDWTVTDIAPSPDGGFFLCGNIVLQNPTIYAAKLDEDGNELWEKSYVLPDSQYYNAAKAVTPTPDGGYLIVGDKVQPGADQTGFLLKTDGDGNFQWFNSFTSTLLNDVEPVAGGGYVVTGGNDDGSLKGFVAKVSDLGTNEWFTELTPPPNSYYFTKIIPLADGSSIAAGTGLAGKVDALGNIIWIKTLDGFTHFDGVIHDAALTAAGDIILSGTIITPEYFDYQALLYKLNANGDKVWKRSNGDIFFSEKGSGLLIGPEGSIIQAGHRGEEEQANVFLLKTDSLGNLFSSAFAGRLHVDPEKDCLPDSAETGLAGWLVQAIGTHSFATLTDSTGDFTLPVDTGSYQVSVHPLGPYWDVCNSPLASSITTFHDTVGLDFPVAVDEACPYLDISITTPFLRRCFLNTYTVQYCNYGTIPAEDAYVEVTLDSFLNYQSSTIPLFNQNGNTLSFLLDTIDVNQCGSFRITAYLNCDSTILGQAHCSEAHIFPDSLCIPTAPLWDGSSVEVDVECVGDSIIFTIQNTGAEDMSEPLDYIIIEDQIVLMDGSFQLNAGQTTTVSIFANGATLHLEAEQATAHPSGASSVGTTIEGCGGWLSLGFFTQYSSPDASPFVDIDCQQNIGSFDPNDKQAFPGGFGDEHLIEPQEDIEYLIRFQNTGTDTAFKVVILDLLPEELDLTTLRPGASSHGYTYSLTQEGWPVFTFDNIMLPDSNVNEPASHGFVRFRISQKEETGHGDVIENAALIYFDFNAPIRTNTTVHKVGQVFPWTPVSSFEYETEKPKFRIMPNPITESAILQIENTIPGHLRLLVTSAKGQIIRDEKAFGNSFEFHRHALPAGIYFFKIEKDGEYLGSGKLMMK